MATPLDSLNKVLLAHWNELERHVSGSEDVKALDGHNLDLATVLAVARYNSSPSLSENVYDTITASSNALEVNIGNKDIIYGINTGFGGNADTRTKSSTKLKQDLLRGLQYGVVTGTASHTSLVTTEVDKTNFQRDSIVLPLDHEVKSCMPESWLRATILVRLNSLAYGASGVLSPTVKALLQLLQKDIIPRVPLRGSISASGDLSPLAYVAGVLEGKPSLNVWIGNRSKGQRHLERADIALNEHSLDPIILSPREALALVNGTSVSAAVAALAMHEALCLAALAQILTALSVEALRGTDESFDPFFAAVRPHWGQGESARNIYAFLLDSSLVFRGHGSEELSLRQDRYSIRTASQWIGPALEDLYLAHSQITIELNSATDNPLIDMLASPPRVLHGGNFQAKSITSATEKIRQVAQSLGRLHFTQCTELINPATSRGLPPNLVVDEPSESFTFKGTDILIASLLSELGFLANPVASHVQSAEMGNQALNSLALVSARYTLDALDVLGQLAAAHLVAVCQALDLRALHTRFVDGLKYDFYAILAQDLYIHLADPETLAPLQSSCWAAFVSRVDTTMTLDTSVRISGAISHVEPLIFASLAPSADSMVALTRWTKHFRGHAIELYDAARKHYMNGSDGASGLLGRAGRRMYEYVRGTLGVPFVGANMLTTPPLGDRVATGITMGDLNGRVRGAMANGELYHVVVECLREVAENEGC
ncbi:hypothetical protein MMC22_000939 [Lobaria immixta]|nr:hypothetical protein [Lobaria immixta]